MEYPPLAASVGWFISQEEGYWMIGCDVSLSLPVSNAAFGTVRVMVFEACVYATVVTSTDGYT